MTGRSRVAAAAIVLLAGVAGCAPAGGGWRKAGADAAAAAGAYRDCRATAASAVGRELGIDQDILATRQSDWQRAPIGGVASAAIQDETRDRAAAILAACMQAKGFVRQR